jgi:anti-anti-sigma factor
LCLACLRAFLGDLKGQNPLRSVADLAGLAFIDFACLSVQHCEDTRSQGGSFTLAGLHGAVHRILALTGLLMWFDVHDTVEEAIRRACH